MFMKIFIKISICLKLSDPDNEKVISKMKDECKGKIIDQFVGLKLKMHSIKDVDVR